jgi:beta-glucosidase
MLVTENGVPANDDTLRVEYIKGALTELRTCLEKDMPIHGYLHWSLLDNFEWNQGFNMQFGLIAVDLKTFKRTPKPSAHYLGEIARKNEIPLI